MLHFFDWYNYSIIYNIWNNKKIYYMKIETTKMSKESKNPHPIPIKNYLALDPFLVEKGDVLYLENELWEVNNIPYLEYAFYAKKKNYKGFLSQSSTYFHPKDFCYTTFLNVSHLTSSQKLIACFVGYEYLYFKLYPESNRKSEIAGYYEERRKERRKDFWRNFWQNLVKIEDSSSRSSSSWGSGFGGYEKGDDYVHPTDGSHGSHGGHH